MDVNGLWDVHVLEPATSEVPLLLLALANWYYGTAPHVPYVIGVDARFEQCQQQMWYRAHPRSGQNPLLCSFIFRVACLARLPIHLVFCYDGKERPCTKRGREVRTSDHWMVCPTRRILNAFNIPWLMAPGKAEAQLAQMSQAGMIDAVMTDNSNAFVFGAHTVLRNSSLTPGDSIKVYTIDAIKQYMLCMKGGGIADCEDQGLRRCGNNTALGLVRCGAGKGLHHALQLRNHLAHDPTKMMGCLHPSIAASLPNTFLPLDTARIYLEPVVIPSVDVPPVGDPRPPNELLGWEDRDKLLETFCSTIWPAVVLKEILLDLRRCSPNSIRSSLWVWMPLRIFDCWTHTMFLGTSAVTPPLQATMLRDEGEREVLLETTDAGYCLDLGVIDLTVDEFPSPAAGPSTLWPVIDLTQDD
ncbi:hypothetical protein PAXRUDRAFT_29230 [Paxillus rubicundulus Ve08.2h10]|uniref:XPG-I domain-containing protein n=1 Tax=Paxillus rubicundulus Ve08.2h10 TaxID=930991 RepID=A0A0D0CDT5_9AGAM|nr:hypothetical protein PAXRUDRAFT_29230 [Paxillus rubicundulus Ve08.2h10]